MAIIARRLVEIHDGWRTAARIMVEAVTNTEFAAHDLTCVVLGEGLEAIFRQYKRR